METTHCCQQMCVVIFFNQKVQQLLLLIISKINDTIKIGIKLSKVNQLLHAFGEKKQHCLVLNNATLQIQCLIFQAVELKDLRNKRTKYIHQKKKKKKKEKKGRGRKIETKKKNLSDLQSYEKASGLMSIEMLENSS